MQVSSSWVYKHKDLLGGVRLGKRLWRFPEQVLTTLLSQPAMDVTRSITTVPEPLQRIEVGASIRQ